MFKTRNIILGLVSAIAIMTGASAQAGSMPFMPRGQIAGAPMGFAELCRRDADACGAPSGQLALLGAMPGLTPTSSVGAVAPRHFDAADQDAEDGANLITVQIVEAWIPAAVEDFVAAGQPRPVEAAAPVAVAQAAAQAAAPWSTRAEREQMKLLNQINQGVNRTIKKATDQDLYGQEEYWALPRLIGGKLYGDCEDYALEKRRQLIAAGVPEAALSMAVAFTARGESHAVLMVSLKSGDWVLDNLTPWATPWEDLNYRWVERQVPGTAFWTTIA